MAASSTRAIFFALGANTGIAVQAQMVPQTSAEALVAAINRVEDAIRTHWPQMRWVFFEPELPHAPAAKA